MHELELVTWRKEVIPSPSIPLHLALMSLLSPVTLPAQHYPLLFQHHPCSTLRPSIPFIMPMDFLSCILTDLLLGPSINLRYYVDESLSFSFFLEWELCQDCQSILLLTLPNLLIVWLSKMYILCFNLRAIVRAASRVFFKRSCCFYVLRNRWTPKNQTSQPNKNAAVRFSHSCLLYKCLCIHHSFI